MMAIVATVAEFDDLIISMSIQMKDVWILLAFLYTKNVRVATKQNNNVQNEEAG